MTLFKRYNTEMEEWELIATLSNSCVAVIEYLVDGSPFIYREYHKYRHNME